MKVRYECSLCKQSYSKRKQALECEARGGSRISIGSLVEYEAYTSEYGPEYFLGVIQGYQLKDDTSHAFFYVVKNYSYRISLQHRFTRVPRQHAVLLCEHNDILRSFELTEKVAGMLFHAYGNE